MAVVFNPPMLDSTPILTRPFTIGMWVYPLTTGTAFTMWSLNDPVSANNYCGIRATATNVFSIYARGGGTENSATIGTVAASRWYFLLARFISPTNDRLSVIDGGAILGVQRTTTRTPVATQINLGSLQFSSLTNESGASRGYIAEYWIANGDIQEDGAAMNDNILRMIAYNGPLSVPTVAAKVRNYRPFLTVGGNIGSNYVTNPDEAFGNNGGPYSISGIFQNFNNQGNPPLCAGYVPPTQRNSITLI